jgi:hypothetical protein
MLQILLFHFVFIFVELNPWRTAHPEELMVAQLGNKFPVFYGLRRFIAFFKMDDHWFLSLGTCLAHTLTSYYLKIYSNIILPSTTRSRYSSLQTFE